MTAPGLVVLLTWGVTLGWFCLVGAWAGALARPAVGALGAMRVSMWLGFGLVTAFVLAAGLLWPLRSAAALVAAATLTVAAVAAWIAVRRRVRRSAEGHDGPALTRSWWVVVPVLAVLVVAYVAADSVFGPVTNYDTGLYHLNAIRYAQDDPTIPGLANLHTRLGTNVSAFNLAALLSNTAWGADAFRLVAGLFVMAGLADVAIRLLDGRPGTWRRPGTYVLVLAVAVAVPGLLAVPGYRLASPSPDTMAMIVTIVAGGYLVEALATGRRAWTGVAVVTAGLAASTRTQLWVVFAATLAVLAARWMVGRRRPTSPPATGPRTLVAASLALSVTTGVLLAVRDAILSGWLLFPATILPVPVDWRVPQAAAQSTRDWILSWARDPEAGPEQTLTSWYWLGSWAGRTVADWWVAAGLVLLAAGVIAWAVSVAVGRGRVAPGSLGGRTTLVLALVPTVTGIGVWFLTAPDPRFAWGSLLLLGAIPAGLASVRLYECWPADGGRRPGVVGVVATGLLAILAVPYGVLLARTAEETPAGTVAETRAYDFGPITVVANVIPLPRPPITAYPLPDGHKVGLTQGGDQCWEFVPCMPYPSDTLRFRGDGVADGFASGS